MMTRRGTWVVAFTLLMVGSGLAAIPNASGTNQHSAVPAGSITVTLTTNRSGNQIDAGDTIQFTATPQGSSYTYLWLGLPASCPSQDVSVLSCLYPSNSLQGITYVTVNVTDSVGDYGQTTIRVDVYYPPSKMILMTPFGGGNWTDVNGTVWSGGIKNITWDTNGGVSPFTYHWTAPAALNCTSGTGAYALTLHCVPTAVGNYTVTVYYTDTDGFASPTNSSGFQVYSDPTLTPMVASPTWIELGQTVNFTSYVKGGNLGAGYTGGSNPGGSTNMGCTLTSWPSGKTNKLQFTCTPTLTGTYALSWYVSQIQGITSNTAGMVYTVHVGPSVTLSTNRSVTDTGLPISLNATATGGSGTYTLNYAGLPPGCVSKNSSALSCTPTKAGNFTVTVKATDTLGFNATSIVNLTVYTHPGVTSPIPTVPTADVGQGVNFTTIVSGGAPNSTVSWSVPAGLGCANSTTVTLYCTTQLPGQYNLTVRVSDVNGGTATATTTYTVYSDPTATVTESRPSADVGQNVTFTAHPTNGTGSYLRYNWSTSGGLSCTPSTGPTLNCTATKAGVPAAGVFVAVWDSNGERSGGTGIFYNVFVDAYAPSLSCPATTSFASFVNCIGSLNGSIKNAAYPYTMNWNHTTSLNCTVNADNSSSEDLRCLAETVGTGTVSLSATDANGWTSPTVTATLTITMAFSSLYATAGNQSANANGTLKDNGVNVTFQAGFSGGTAPWTCSLTQNGSTSMLATTETATQDCTLTYLWPHGGTYVATVTVSDSAGHQASAWILVDATAPSPPSKGTNTVVMDGLSAQAGSAGSGRNGTLQDNDSPVTFTATFHNGTGPFACTLTQNGSSSTLASSQSPGKSCTLTYTWKHGGTYVATVTVTDSVGTHSSAWVVVDATASTSPPPPGGNSTTSKGSTWPSWWWIIPVAAVAIVALLVALVIASVRRPGPPADSATANSAIKEEESETTKEPPDWFESSPSPPGTEGTVPTGDQDSAPKS